ncbi:MAG: DUF5662 family protein [Bacilli bacterium]
MSHIFKHFHLVNQHRFKVFINCTKCGFIWRGLVHDLSKYSRKEFVTSAKYYQGNSSPIYEERKHHDMYSSVAIHHTRHNKHHFEYWIDTWKGDIVLPKIPYKYSVEYVCDVIAASETYNKKSYKKDMPLNYFLEREGYYLMHPMNKEFIEFCLKEYANNGFKGIKKKITKQKYKEINANYPKEAIIIPFYSKEGKF